MNNLQDDLLIDSIFFEMKYIKGLELYILIDFIQNKILDIN